MAEHVYEIREVANRGGHRDDYALEAGGVYASAADAQKICDDNNEVLIAEEFKYAIDRRDAIVSGRKTAIEANLLLEAGGSDRRVHVPELPAKGRPIRKDIIKKVSKKSGWLFVEAVTLVPASNPEPEPVEPKPDGPASEAPGCRCFFCGESLAGGPERGTWTSDRYPGPYYCPVSWSRQPEPAPPLPPDNAWPVGTLRSL